MKIIFFQHVEFEKPRLLETWAKEKNHEYKIVHWYRGESIDLEEEYDMLCILGGPMSVNDEISWYNEEKLLIFDAIKRDKVVIGICLGAQLIAQALGANVYRSQQKEIGWFPIDCDLSFLENKMNVFHWHGETFDLPEHCRILARSEACVNQAFVYNEKVLGMQFHLEMDESGVQDILNECSDELIQGRFIQSKEQQLLGMSNIENCKLQLYDLLDGIELCLRA